MTKGNCESFECFSACHARDSIWRLPPTSFGGRLAIMFFITKPQITMLEMLSAACFLHLEEHFHPCLLRQKDYLMRSKVYVILAYFPPYLFFAYCPIINCGKSNYICALLSLIVEIQLYMCVIV